MKEISIVWLRRDLRLHDQAALYHALRKSPCPVVLLFIFDKNILDDLIDRDDKRVTFIYDTLVGIRGELRTHHSDFLIKYGSPSEVWKELVQTYRIIQMHYNRDYEPYAKKRDSEVTRILQGNGVEVIDYKDHLIFESHEVTKDGGDPYVVFTPYKKAWMQRLEEELSRLASQKLPSYDPEAHFSKLAEIPFDPMLTLESMGFTRSNARFPEKKTQKSLLQNYHKIRDFPAVKGTSRLGIHLRFGTISIRALVNAAKSLNEVFLSELIRREFYSHILDRFPRVVGESFKPRYDQIEWKNDEHDFITWCEGRTGYPLVDAGMRELNETGYMHNRVRMITASFLTKHLLIDWRWGEAYFARKLMDYDLASNNGGWQWAAGCGTDAAPYFRIFSPEAQQKKFDPELKYIRKWVPEVNDLIYPDPVVDHRFARDRCLSVYKKALL